METSTNEDYLCLSLNVGSSKRNFLKTSALALVLAVFAVLTACSAEQTPAQKKAASVKRILAKDIADLVAKEYKALDPKRMPEPRPGFGVQLSGDFDLMMRGAPPLDPKAPNFHEGNAYFFHEEFGKMMLISGQNASPEFQQELRHVFRSAESADGVGAFREVAARIGRLQTRNKGDVFLKKFFVAYAGDNHKMGVIMTAVDKRFAHTTPQDLPTIEELAREVRAHADALGALVYRPAMGPRDVALRKAGWKALDKVAKEAEVAAK